MKFAVLKCRVAQLERSTQFAFLDTENDVDFFSAHFLDQVRTQPFSCRRVPDFSNFRIVMRRRTKSINRITRSVRKTIQTGLLLSNFYTQDPVFEFASFCYIVCGESKRLVHYRLAWRRRQQRIFRQSLDASGATKFRYDRRVSHIARIDRWTTTRKNRPTLRLDGGETGILALGAAGAARQTQRAAHASLACR